MRTRKVLSLWCLLGLVGWGACASNPGSGGGNDGGTNNKDGGFTTPVCQNNYCVRTLDPTQSFTSEPAKYLSMAIGPNDRVGVAYFVRVAAEDYEIRYIEWNSGTVSTPQVVKTVQRVYGVSVAFDATGEPVIAYLGGTNDGVVFWLQSDLEVSYRSGGSTWTPHIAVTQSGEAMSGVSVSDTGLIVGLFPAIVFDGTTAHVAYRDVHSGQNTTDWAKSDLEVASGGPTSWVKRVALLGGNTLAGAYGGHSQMVMASGQPSLVGDQIRLEAEAGGQNVIFTRRNANGSWTAEKQVMAIGDTQAGPSIAYDSTLGFAVAAVDRSDDSLWYSQSTDLGVTWSAKFPVFQSGTGGWWPSVAISPQFHDPSIVFFVCARRTGVQEGACVDGERELRIAERASGNWRIDSVVAGDFALPKLGFLSNGKRVIVFREFNTGVLLMAEEQ